MGIKVLRDAKARPYVAIVNGRLQRVRPKERYWALADQATAHRTALPHQVNARAVSSPQTVTGPVDDDPPDLGYAHPLEGSWDRFTRLPFLFAPALIIPSSTG